MVDNQNLVPRSLSDLSRWSEKSAERGQILPDLQRQYRDIDQKAGEIGTVQVILQPIDLKSDRLLALSDEKIHPFLNTNLERRWISSLF